MGFFDFLDFSWKKSFDELLSSNREAVESYIKKRYKIYDDMRPDDKSLIEDYLTSYEKLFLPLTTYIEPIDSISKDAKKYLVERKGEILKLHSAFSKYSTPRKRVLSLYNRFKKDNVFEAVFSEVLGENYNINNLADNQISFILENYQELFVYASVIRDSKVQKQQALKNRLRERSQDRKIAELIRRQENSSSEISLSKDHSEISKKLKSIVDGLLEEYNANGIFARVYNYLYDDDISTDSLTDAQYINIIAHKCDLEKEKQFFELISQDFGCESSYKTFLKSKDLQDDHKGILYCLEHFVELQVFSMAYEETAQFQQWINTQRNLNEKGCNLAKSYLPDFTCRVLRMYIETTNVNGEQIRKVLPFNHYTLHDFTYESRSISDLRASYAYVFYNKEKAEKAKHSIVTCDYATLTELSDFVFNIMAQMAVGGVIVVLGTSGADDVKKYNDYHFWFLKEELEKYNIECVNYNELDQDNIKRHVVVVEMVSEVERLRETCRGLSRSFPGSTISYISFYSELTKNQLANIKVEK